MRRPLHLGSGAAGPTGEVHRRGLVDDRGERMKNRTLLSFLEPTGVSRRRGSLVARLLLPSVCRRFPFLFFRVAVNGKVGEGEGRRESDSDSWCEFGRQHHIGERRPWLICTRLGPIISTDCFEQCENPLTVHMSEIRGTPPKAVQYCTQR